MSNHDEELIRQARKAYEYHAAQERMYLRTNNPKRARVSRAKAKDANRKMKLLKALFSRNKKKNKKKK